MSQHDTVTKYDEYITSRAQLYIAVAGYEIGYMTLGPDSRDVQMRKMMSRHGFFSFV